MKRNTTLLYAGILIPAGLAFGAYLFFLTQASAAFSAEDSLLAEGARVNAETAFSMFSLLLLSLACAVCWTHRARLWRGLALYAGLSAGLLALCGSADALWDPYASLSSAAATALSLWGGGLFWYLLAAAGIRCVFRVRARYGA